ncbi:MAG: SHOCT domain-containing protein [Chloroflexi bacterium]|nr:SHOCT domain-containing protein [Chloroflexota bacterium]
MMMEFSNTGWLMMAFMVIFWGFVIGVIILVGRSLTQSGQTDPTLDNRKSAIEILKKQYTAGDISQEEYRIKKCDLIWK